MNRVQNIRKGRGYDIVDKISITFEPNAATDEAIKAYSDYMARQVLATSINVAPLAADALVETLDLDGVEVKTVIELIKP